VPASLQCNNEFPEAPRRGARPQTYCNPKCQIKAANERRSIKRRGEAQGPSNLSTGGAAPGRPVASDPMRISPSAKTPPSDSPSARINALMALAHSRGGIDPWQVAELARLRNISPWAPLRVIIGKSIS
jgi:hypothetical protein